MSVQATTKEAAETMKAIEDEEISKMTALCIGSVNISGFTKHGLAQIMGRDGGRGVSNSAILDAINNPIKIVNQTAGKVKYIGKNATIVLNEAKKVITAWATSSLGNR